MDGPDWRTMTSGDKPSWNWHDEGFKFDPKRVQLRPPLNVCRVWAGISSEMGSDSRPGVCFSFEQPKSRKEAEGLSSVWEWGNTCRSITPFRIEAGATIFVGKVHPGDFCDHGLGSPGSQIFVERNQISRFVRKIGPASKLVDDLGANNIVPHRDPGGPRSS
jgi:hypothetical protein